MEQLLLAPPSRAHCPYLVLLAQEMQSEARALEAAFDELGRRDWNTDEAFARALFGEWINQWLGGLERLRWTHVEQPVQKARTSGSARAPAYARQSAEDNRLDWLAQWRALRELAVLPTDRDEAPKPGQDVVPIEALLMGRGHLDLAQRWAQAVDAGDRAFAQLPAVPSDAELMALSQTLKRITVLYQTEVAAALDVPLGVSDADGD
jgi:predicted lipoprotein